jgi:hypothetical protein
MLRGQRPAPYAEQHTGAVGCCGGRFRCVTCWMMLILVRSFVSVPQDVLAASSTVRVVRLDRDYDDLDDLLGVCEIDGVPRTMLSVHEEHDGPWREGGWWCCD